MTIGQKFDTSAKFVTYIEACFGLGFVDSKLTEFYKANKSTRFTYTGILKSLKAL